MRLSHVLFNLTRMGRFFELELYLPKRKASSIRFDGSLSITVCSMVLSLLCHSSLFDSAMPNMTMFLDLSMVGAGGLLDAGLAAPTGVDRGATWHGDDCFC